MRFVMKSSPQQSNKNTLPQYNAYMEDSNQETMQSLLQRLKRFGIADEKDLFKDVPDEIYLNSSEDKKIKYAKDILQCHEDEEREIAELRRAHARKQARCGCTIF